MSKMSSKTSRERAKRRLEERRLDQALKDTFPASDPIALAEPAPARKRAAADGSVAHKRGAPKRPARH